MSAKPAPLQSIQFGRGVAACLVVLYHTGRMLTEPQYVGHPFILTSLFSFGNAGVDFFFVLSGFIIFYVHGRDIGRAERLPHYLWQRVTRIYPIYWVVTFLVMATLVAKQDWASLNIPRVLESFLLLPGGQDPLLGVAWTLVHEVAFYAVFAIAIISRRAGAVAAAAALALAIAPFESHSALVTFFQTPFHYEFALGAFAAFMVGKPWFKSGWLLGIVGLAAFCSGAWLVDSGMMGNTGTAGRLWFGIASCLLVTGAAKAELRGRIRIPPLGSYLGAASYSIYLIHTLIIGWSARVLFSFSFAHGMPIATALSVCLLAVAGGCLLHTGIEKPLQNAIRGKARVRATAEAV